MSREADLALERLRAKGLTYPGTHLKSPWPEHLDLAVKDKTFAFLAAPGQPFSISVKLPFTSGSALLLPFVEPTGYGLGRSGWVSARIPSGEIPVALFEDWLDESYRAQAPKSLVKLLDADGPTSAPPSSTNAAATTTPARKTAPKKGAAKKGPTKTGPAKMAPVKKAPAKKAPAKKAPAKDAGPRRGRAP